MTTTNQQREDGFYWVKFLKDEDIPENWFIAEYTDKLFYRTGVRYKLFALELDIDPTRIVREEP